MSDRLLSLMTRQSMTALNTLIATPGGPEVLTHAHKVIDRMGANQSDEVRATARIIVAGWPGLTRRRITGDLAFRLSSAEAAAVGAVRRCVATEMAGRPDEEPTADDALRCAADAATFNGHNDPAPAPDAFTATTRRDILSDVLVSVLGDDPSAPDPLAAPIIRAIAYPSDSRKDGALINRAAILRSMGARTKGKGGAVDRARLDIFLAELTATGVDTLAAHAMVGPGASGPSRARITPTAEVLAVAAESVVRPGGAFHAGQPIWHPGTAIRGAVSPVVTTAPGRYGYAVGAKWVTLADRSMLVDGATATAILAGGAWSETGAVGAVVPFLAPTADDDLSTAPARSAVAVKGVRPGTVHGTTGARAGQGKAFVKITSSKRKRDGGIGSPMI